MVAVAMTNDELLVFVRKNFIPEDVFPRYMIFEDKLEVQSYLEDEGWHHEDDCEWEGIASDNGWVYLADDPTLLEQAAEKIGLTIGPDQATIDFQHDTQGHTSSVAYCETGLCQLTNY